MLQQTTSPEVHWELPWAAASATKDPVKSKDVCNMMGVSSCSSLIEGPVNETFYGKSSRGNENCHIYSYKVSDDQASGSLWDSEVHNYIPTATA